jgi:hypothetical protein
MPPTPGVNIGMDLDSRSRFQMQNMSPGDSQELRKNSGKMFRANMHEHFGGVHDVEGVIGIREPSDRRAECDVRSEPRIVRPSAASGEHGGALVKAINIKTGNANEIAEMTADPATEFDDLDRSMNIGVRRHVLSKHDFLNVIQRESLLAILILVGPNAAIFTPILVIGILDCHGAALQSIATS